MTKQKKIIRLQAFITAIMIIIAAIAMTGCGDEESDGAGYSFTCTLYKNPENLDPQLAVDKSSLMIIKNMFLGLMTFNSDGILDYGMALSYKISDDGLKYSFTIRDDCHWYSADGTEDLVTAHDFVFAFKRIFNPETRSPYREKFSFIKNAQAIIDGEADYSGLGVYAVNNTELVFYLDRPCSEFLYLLTTAPAMPCNKNFFDGTKARYGLDDESVISNGAFYITQWSYDPYGNDNLIYMKRNYDNSQYDRVYPYMITFIIERDKNAAEENFNASETDCVVSEISRKKTFIEIYDTDSYTDLAEGIIFNPDYDINYDIKKALSLCIDREVLENIVPENLSAAYGIIPESLYIDKIKYRDEVIDSEFGFYKNEMPDITEDIINEFYNQEPDNIKILVRNKSDGGLIGRITNDWYEKLGIFIGIDYVDDDEYYERLAAGDYFMALAEVSSDDRSVYYFMKNILKFSSDESDEIFLDSALETTDVYQKKNIFYEIERGIIESADYIPVFYHKIFLVYKNDAKDLWFNPFSGEINFRYAKYFE